MLIDNLSQTEIWLLGTILFIVRYVIIAGIFFCLFYLWRSKDMLGRKLQPVYPKLSQIKREVLYSILTFIIYGSCIWLFLFWIQNGQTALYSNIDAYGRGYFFLSIVLMIILHDAYFYWTHRLMHHPRMFKYTHKLHHSFTSPTPWASFAFHPLEALISIGIVPIILFAIPYHQLALITFITLLTINNVVIHLGYSIPWLKSLKFCNTSNAHDLHHAGTKGNYGLYFSFWDRVMGTYIPK